MYNKILPLSSLVLLITSSAQCNESEFVSNVSQTAETTDATQLEQALSAAELEVLEQIESLVKKIQTSEERNTLILANFNLNDRYEEFCNARNICLAANNCGQSYELKQAFYAFNQAGIEYAQAIENMDQSDCKKVDAQQLVALMKKCQQ